VNTFYGAGIQFLAQVSRYESAEDLEDSFAKFISHVGLVNFRMSQRPQPGSLAPPGTIIGRIPEGWLDHYRHEKFKFHDPVLMWTSRELGPISWARARTLVPTDAKSRQLEADAKEVGLVDGIAFSASGRNGLRGNIWLGSPTPLQLQKGDMRILHFCSAAAYEAAGALLGTNDRPLRSLTPRQREALSWAARGKTEAEAALVMGISRKTVDAFLQEARARLGAVSTPQAIALTIEAGELN